MITYMGIKMTYEDRYIIAHTLATIRVTQCVHNRTFLEHELSGFINDIRAAQ